jgi:hypothetical protein
VIAESPALLAREQQAMTRSAADLAALLAAETGAPATTCARRWWPTPCSGCSGR